MPRLAAGLVCVLFGSRTFAADAKDDVKKVLDDQVVAWNKGDVEGYMQGYWQSARYFEDSAERVRQEFRFRSEPSGRNVELAEEIGARAAVSLHVRRGDYAAHAATRAYHGLCPVDYYHRAASYVAERVRDPIFVLFSDDPEWTRTHLDLRARTIAIEHNGPDDGAEDLRLMSLCRHHVIANSTFSWWGAWLCTKPEKIVTAPERWFSDGARDTSDLIPDRWVRL